MFHENTNQVILCKFCKNWPQGMLHSCTAGTNKILICGSTHKESLILELLIQQCRKSISHPLTQPMQLSFSLLCQRFLLFIPTHSWLPTLQERNVTQLCFLLREVVNDFLLKCGEMVSHFVNNFITREPGAMADKTPDLCQFAVWKLKKRIPNYNLIKFRRAIFLPLYLLKKKNNHRDIWRIFLSRKLYSFF